jgi:hypothetical protein
MEILLGAIARNSLIRKKVSRRRKTFGRRAYTRRNRLWRSRDMAYLLGI